MSCGSIEESSQRGSIVVIKNNLAFSNHLLNSQRSENGDHEVTLREWLDHDYWEDTVAVGELQN